MKQESAMKPCQEYESRIKELLAGELAWNERSSLVAHAAACAGCRSLLVLHESLGRFTLETPAEADFKELRLSVLRSLPLRFASPIHRSATSARRVAAWALAASLLAAGVALGYLWGSRRQSDSDVLVSQISRQARETKQVEDVTGAPYIYSNVALKNVDERTVALSFDVSTHIDLTTRRDDPLVKEALVQTLLNPAPVGTRLKAIAYAGNLMDPEIKEALLLSMLHDPNVAVRLKAQSILAARPGDPEIQAAFLKILRQEESVQMRLSALDYLVHDRIDRETLKQVIEGLHSEKDTAVRTRATAYFQ